MSGKNYAGERGTPGLPGKQYPTQNIELCAKDEEIARLRVQHEEMLLKHAREENVALEALKQALKEIERLKALLARAVDALDRGPLFPQPLVDELRKAAK